MTMAFLQHRDDARDLADPGLAGFTLDGPNLVSDHNGEPASAHYKGEAAVGGHPR